MRSPQRINHDEVYF
uniref:Uncharacterized protein n=1 Tax=Bos taurus TaxID=9913 RepID=V9GZQ7_BOVIN|nr:adrenodoxin associated ORF; putative [Bos taurus]